MGQDLLTYEEASRYLGIAVGTLYSLVCRRTIPHVRLSKRIIRFKKTELEKLIEQHSVQVFSSKRERSV